MLDPTLENEKYSWDPYDRGTKMYNESCTQYKQYQQEYPQFMDKWLRKCPVGVTTCFWAKGIRWRKPEDDKDDLGKAWKSELPEYFIDELNSQSWQHWKVSTAYVIAKYSH